MNQRIVEALDLVISRRRDVRAEFNGTPPDPAEVTRLLTAAHAAPSVGNSQPWDFIVVRSAATRNRLAEHVETCRQAYANSLDPDRRATFDPIKIEGIRESGLGIAVTYDPRRTGPNVLGRHTIDDAGIFSVVCAIQNLWLTATALDLGVGWVSFYEEDILRELLGIPQQVRPVAWLCVGHLTNLQETPDLIRAGWNDRIALKSVTHAEHW